VGALHDARIARGWGAQERVNQGAAGEERMPMPSVAFGRYRPLVVDKRLFKLGVEQLERGGAQGRAVDGSNHGGLGAVSENFAQANPQRTELTQFRVGIANHRRTARLDHGCKIVSVFSGYHNDRICDWSKRKNCGGEQR
jgi:hypothetical protein